MDTILYFDITRDCDNRCNYCFRKEDEVPTNILSTQDIEHIIDETCKLTDLYAIVISGGEPLFNENTIKKTYEIADYCKNKFIPTALYTNGNKIAKNPDMLRELDAMFDIVNIGIHDFDIYGENGEIFEEILNVNKERHGSLHFTYLINDKNRDPTTIINIIERFGIENLYRNNIFIHFEEAQPLGNNPQISSKYETYKTMSDIKYFIDYARHKNGNITTSFIGPNKRHIAKYVTETIIPIQTDGTAGYTIGCYKPHLGNALENIKEIIDRKNKINNILELYDIYGLLYEVAEKRAKSKNIDYNQMPLTYVYRVINDLFEEYPNYDDIERMVEDFEEILSHSHPLTEYQKYEELYPKLELWQKRVLQQIEESDEITRSVDYYSKFFGDELFSEIQNRHSSHV